MCIRDSRYRRSVFRCRRSILGAQSSSVGRLVSHHSCIRSCADYSATLLYAAHSFLSGSGTSFAGLRHIRRSVRRDHSGTGVQLSGITVSSLYPRRVTLRSQRALCLGVALCTPQHPPRLTNRRSQPLAMKIIIERTWGSVIGLASTTIGILKFASIAHIPTLDALIHIVTGLIFIAGAWVNKGQYVGQTNRYLGMFYIVFGAVGMNWAHIIVGVVSILIGLLT